VSTSVAKRNEGLSNKVSNIIRIYIYIYIHTHTSLYHMLFDSYMAVSFITFCHILLDQFCITVYMDVRYVWFYVILYIKYIYCYVISVLCILFHCVVLCTVCV
jgi:hypothetical protein